MAMRRSNGAHIWKSEAGASMRKQGRRAAAGEVIERVLHDQSPKSARRHYKLRDNEKSQEQERRILRNKTLGKKRRGTQLGRKKYPGARTK